jgi:hypothetical protein
MLWIKGDPDKGKTMLLCGIINELKTSMPKSHLLSYLRSRAYLRGCMATTPRRQLLSKVLRTFTGFRFGLMVGIGGGIPNLEKEIDVRLGDVVVSQPHKIHGGVTSSIRSGQEFKRGYIRTQRIFKTPSDAIFDCAGDSSS